MPQKAAQCWACLDIFSDAVQGVAIDGGDTPQICIKCWRKTPIAKRIMLAAMLRDRANGGLGVAELVARLNRALEEAGHDVDMANFWRRGGSEN